jgi:hypothetical protein
MGSVGGIDIGTEHEPAVRTALNNRQVLIKSQLPVCGIRYGWMRLADNDPPSHNRRGIAESIGLVPSEFGNCVFARSKTTNSGLGFYPSLLNDNGTTRQRSMWVFGGKRESK